MIADAQGGHSERDDITGMLRSHRGDANRDMLGDELWDASGADHCCGHAPHPSPCDAEVGWQRADGDVDLSLCGCTARP